MDQLVELLTPEVCGSNSVICINLSSFNCIEKTKIMKKRPGMAYFVKKLRYADFKISGWLIFLLAN